MGHLVGPQIYFPLRGPTISFCLRGSLHQAGFLRHWSQFSFKTECWAPVSTMKPTGFPPPVWLPRTLGGVPSLDSPGHCLPPHVELEFQGKFSLWVVPLLGSLLGYSFFQCPRLCSKRTDLSLGPYFLVSLFLPSGGLEAPSILLRPSSPQKESGLALWFFRFSFALCSLSSFLIFSASSLSSQQSHSSLSSGVSLLNTFSAAFSKSCLFS